MQGVGKGSGSDAALEGTCMIHVSVSVSLLRRRKGADCWCLLVACVNGVGGAGLGKGITEGVASCRREIRVPLAIYVSRDERRMYQNIDEEECVKISWRCCY